MQVSSGEDEPDRSLQPLESTQHTYTLRITVKGTTEPVTLRVDMIDDTGSQTILEEQHDPDEVVEREVQGYGSPVIFKIYYNGDLRKQYTQKADTSEVPQ